MWDMYQNGNTPNKELITWTLTYNEDDDRLFSSLMRHAIWSVEQSQSSKIQNDQAIKFAFVGWSAKLHAWTKNY